jgi:8-oxo-dGTP pyrophosphatase MutT (NUDIX family)
MAEPTKVCPILIRNMGSPQILVFRHPTAGIQLIKGTIEPCEDPGSAALRELREESGIDTTTQKDLGVWDTGFDGQIWSLQLCFTPPGLPESWDHFCADDGGLSLELFWHDLHCGPTHEWHPLFQSALQIVCDRYERLKS